MKNKNILVGSCFLVYFLIVFLPPIIHNYIYPTSGDDTASYLYIFKNCDLLHQAYFAYAIVGYPLNWLSYITSLNIVQIFFWFHYIVLLGVGITFYLVVSKLINYKAGLLSLFIPIFIANGIRAEFYFGEIFNIINIGIIFIWLLYFIVKWIEQRKPHLFIIVVLLSLLFAIFHTTGLYVFPFLLVSIFVYLLYNYRVYHKLDKQILIIGCVLFCISILGLYWLIMRTYVFNPNAFMYWGGITAWYAIDVVSPYLILAVMLVFLFKNDIKINKLVVLLIVMATLLFCGMFIFRSSTDRQLYDLATIFGLIGAVIISELFNNTNKVQSYIYIGLLVACSFLNLPRWLTYNSAVKVADRQTISYVNTLNYQTYSSNSKLTPYIYDLYLDGKYQDSDGDILITRNEPMTYKSDKNTMSYIPHGTDSIAGYNFVKEFIDGELIVSVYAKVDK